MIILLKNQKIMYIRKTIIFQLNLIKTNFFLILDFQTNNKDFLIKMDFKLLNNPSLPILSILKIWGGWA